MTSKEKRDMTESEARGEGLAEVHEKADAFSTALHRIVKEADEQGLSSQRIQMDLKKEARSMWAKGMHKDLLVRLFRTSLHRLLEEAGKDGLSSEAMATELRKAADWTISTMGAHGGDTFAIKIPPRQTTPKT